MNNSIQQFIAAKAFIVHEGKVLILRESSSYDEGTQAGNYDVVGGRLDPGQTVHDALTREIKEETGLSVRIGKPVAVGEWCPEIEGKQTQIVGIFFECFADSDDVVLSEDHDDYVWIDPKEYKSYPIISVMEQIFKDYINK